MRLQLVYEVSFFKNACDIFSTVTLVEMYKILHSRFHILYISHGCTLLNLTVVVGTQKNHLSKMVLLEFLQHLFLL